MGGRALRVGIGDKLDPLPAFRGVGDMNRKGGFSRAALRIVNNDGFHEIDNT